MSERQDLKALLCTKYASAPRKVQDDSSYPATEAGEIDNNSIFSDSIEFDTAEKNDRALNGADHQPNGFAEALGVSYNDADDLVSPDGEETPEKSAHGKYAIRTAKPRRVPLPEPKRWEPIPLQVPADDPDDEFDIGGAQRPIYREETDEKPKYVFVNGEPDLRGEVVSCFDEPGLLYRVVDKKNKVWAFYNDSIAFEIHISCTFGKYSKIEALGNTTLIRNADGCFIAEGVVYSGETELFIKGFVNGFKSRVRAVPLSNKYLVERCELQERNVINEETAMARSAAGSDDEITVDTEKTLAACINANVFFVDPEFPPTQSSIDRGAEGRMRTLPWFRPRMYLRPELVEQVRLFRSVIGPGRAQRGDLGDCWLICSIATLAEDPEEIMRIFRHPRGAAAARSEREVGAYRVTLNKNGLWRSVVVDDFFPAVAGKPMFARSPDCCEVWPSVLEKAYAKMYGSYAMVQSGDPVHALTDISGCPSTRFDDAFAKARVDGSRELFHQFMGYAQAGYQIILITAGRAPALIPGTNEYVGVFTDNQELEGLLGETGLVPGHTYTVLDVRQFREGDEDIQLLKIRNPWGFCAEWNGPWSPSSTEWDRHAAIAEACAPALEGKNIDAIWMSWEHVLKYFKSGAVHFRQTAFDYRVPLTFINCRPSFVVEVSVDSPTWMCFILSNVSYRGLFSERREEEEANDDSGTSGDYPPLMMSLSTSHESLENVHKIIKNTSLDPATPSLDRWSFLQGREVSMVCKLTPEESPYLLVPRIMEREDTVSGSTAWFTQLQDKIHPLHFANRDKSKMDAIGNGSTEIPTVFGIRSSKPIKADGAGSVRVSFKRLGDKNIVFDNFSAFPVETEVLGDVYFQVKAPKCGFAEERFGSSLSLN